MSYAQRVPHTLAEVAIYLIKELKMDSKKATELTKKRMAIFYHGEKMGSFTYYIAEQMVEAERKGLPNDTVEGI